jgi:hypothetical protein
MVCAIAWFVPEAAWNRPTGFSETTAICGAQPANKSAAASAVMEAVFFEIIFWKFGFSQSSVGSPDAF